MVGSFKKREKNVFKRGRIVILRLLVFFVFELIMVFWDEVFIVIFFFILWFEKFGCVVLFCFFRSVVEKFDVYICLFKYFRYWNISNGIFDGIMFEISKIEMGECFIIVGDNFVGICR